MKSRKMYCYSIIIFFLIMFLLIPLGIMGDNDKAKNVKVVNTEDDSIPVTVQNPAETITITGTTQVEGSCECFEWKHHGYE